MGASSSSCVPSESDASVNPPPLKLRLGDVPESCIALVLDHFDAPEICKLARLNRAFRGASSADFIWDTKLPPNYRYIVDKLADEELGGLSKKDLYGRLSRPIPFDGGTKEIWLDKTSGGVCLSISSKALAITGIDDRRYWNHIPTEESRFPTVAYLQQIWWFEVVGEVEFQLPPEKYSLFFRIHLGKPAKKLGRRICNPDQIHGWNIKPAQLQLTTSDGQHVVSRPFLDTPGVWIHYHAGDFVVDKPNVSTKVKFSMMQIDCTHTKGGLCLDSVLICPSSVGKELRSSS